MTPPELLQTLSAAEPGEKSPEARLQDAGNLAEMAHRARLAMSHYRSGANFNRAESRFNAATLLLIDCLREHCAPAAVDAAERALQTTLRAVK